MGGFSKKQHSLNIPLPNTKCANCHVYLIGDLRYYCKDCHRQFCPNCFNIYTAHKKECDGVPIEGKGKNKSVQQQPSREYTQQEYSGQSFLSDFMNYLLVIILVLMAILGFLAMFTNTFEDLDFWHLVVVQTV